MNYESQNIEYKRSGMSVYITRRKGLFGENDGVNDGVKITDNKDIATNDDHVNDHVNDTINDGVKNIDNENIVLKNDTVNITTKYTDNKGNSIRVTSSAISKTDTVNLNKTEMRILQILNMDYNATYSSLMFLLQVSRPTIARAIETLQKNCLVVREGSDKSGHWYVTEKGKEML